jgi:hypothetical protein
MTYRVELENLLTEIRNADRKAIALDHDVHPELDDTIRKVLDGFQNVLNASKVCRDAQKAYFKARKAGQSYDATKLLDESKKAEKILDDLTKFWTNEIQKPVPEA